MTTSLNENTVYTSSYMTDGDAHMKSEIFILHEQFMLATQSGVSGLWDIYDVKVTNAPEIEDEPVYHFTRAKQAIDIQETFNHLAAYEKDKQAKGYVQNDDFAYKNAMPYKDAATAHGLIQDVDTGKYDYLINAAIPENGGSFKASDLDKVMSAIASEFEKSKTAVPEPNLIDQILRPQAPTNLNMSKVLGVVNFNKQIQTLHEAITGCRKYLDHIIKNNGELGYRKRYNFECTKYSDFDVLEQRDTYSITTHRIDSSFEAALAAAKSRTKELDLKDYPEFKQYLEDTTLALEVTYDVITTQFQVKEEFNGNKSVNEPAIKKAFDNIKKKYNNQLSQKQIDALERTFLDIENIRLPRAIADSERRIEVIARESRRQTAQYLENTVKDGESPDTKDTVLRAGPRIYY